jgi:hypothetical protein
MNTDLTYITFILDRSGSMQSMAQEAIGGFNAFIEEQKKEPGDVRLSLVLLTINTLRQREMSPSKRCPK